MTPHLPAFFFFFFGGGQSNADEIQSQIPYSILLSRSKMFPEQLQDLVYDMKQK